MGTDIFARVKCASASKCLTNKVFLPCSGCGVNDANTHSAAGMKLIFPCVYYCIINFTCTVHYFRVWGRQWRRKREGLGWTWRRSKRRLVILSTFLSHLSVKLRSKRAGYNIMTISCYKWVWDCIILYYCRGYLNTLINNMKVLKCITLGFSEHHMYIISYNTV